MLKSKQVQDLHYFLLIIKRLKNYYTTLEKIPKVKLEKQKAIVI